MSATTDPAPGAVHHSPADGAAPPAVIRAEGVVRRFGRRRVLDGVGLAVGRGTVTGLLGRNGAGKSTLLHILLGMLRRHDGSVTVLGMDPARSGPDVRRRVGWVPERPSYPPFLRVRELLDFLRPFHPTWNREEEERLKEWLRIPGESRMRTLSKGETAKTALLAALAHEPDLLVLDEPTGGLDPLVREDFLQAMIDLAAVEGRSVLISSHQVEDLERAADHVAFLADGRIVAAGALADLRQGVRRLSVAGADEAALAGVLQHEAVRAHRATPDGVELLVAAPDAPVRAALESVPGAVVEGDGPATLTDLFRAHTADLRP